MIDLAAEFTHWAWKRFATRTLAAFTVVVFSSSAAFAQSVSFRNDVSAVLSKAGCNQGVCHGNQNGKNGFRLSLRGQDAGFDWTALVRDQFGRRVDPLEPAESLILKKATAEVAHQGGRRFDVDSAEYAILHAWIAGGLGRDVDDGAQLARLEVSPREEVLIAPAERAQIKVQAVFSDGVVRDVTRLAVYEPSNEVAEVTAAGEARRLRDGETAIIVRYLGQYATVQLAFVPRRPDFTPHEVPEDGPVDRHVFAKLNRLRMHPSAPATDEVFLRRAFLDATGGLPTVEETRAFLVDVSSDKRARLIDGLLERPEFADYWALKWCDLLRNEEKVNDRKGVQALHRWLREWIAENRPINELARELIAARGGTYTNPAANYYRANRDPLTAAEATAQVFLGVRLQCARCHNHPFDRWTQDDYYSFASLFARVRYKIVENRRRDRFDRNEFDGEQVVWMAREGEVVHPRDGQPAVPRFLAAAARTWDDDEDRLEALADWVADPANPMFARMQANRVWMHLLGRGVVDPNDDFRLTNPPSNGPLLEELTRRFIASEFNLRDLIRTIMNSRVYQLSAEPNETNVADEANFARAIVRPIEAEALLDALAQATASAVKFQGYPEGLRAGQLPGVQAVRRRDAAPAGGEQFLTTFGKPVRALACECERSRDTTLAQAFQMISGPAVNDLISEPENRIDRLMAAGAADEQIVEEFYLAALCRFPRDEERQAAAAYIENAGDRRAAIEDVVWALLSSKEFMLRR